MKRRTDRPQSLTFLQDHGAAVAEGVDGLQVAHWLRRSACPLGTVRPRQVTLIIWGSPHVELANGMRSRLKSGAAPRQKAAVVETLKAQCPHSFILVLYAGHGAAAVAGAAEAVLALAALLRAAPGRPRQHQLLPHKHKKQPSFAWMYHVIFLFLYLGLR